MIENFLMEQAMNEGGFMEGMGGLPGLSSSSSSNSSNYGYNVFQPGPINVGMGAGSSSFVLIIAAVIAYLGYVLLSNK